MTDLKELHTRIGKILDESPIYDHRPVLFWRGKKPGGEDAFGQVNEIIVCTLKMSPDSSLDGCRNCIVLSPIPDFQDFKVTVASNA